MPQEGPAGLFARWGKDTRVRIGILLAGALAALVGGMMVWGSFTSAAPLPAHGIGFAKGCAGPTLVGESYSCQFTITNNSDTAGDTLTITSIIDKVHATGGDVTSANLLLTATLTPSGGATCNGGQTMCTLPVGASLQTDVIALYTVQANDPNPLTDTATLTFQDLCTSGATNCPSGDLLTQAGSQSSLQTNTPTPTDTPTNTATPTPTNTNTPTPTPTNTPTPTPTNTNTPTPTPTNTNTPTPTPTNTNTPTPSPTATNTPPTATGCTPGYWKNHLAAWGPTGFSPSQTIGSVFVSAPAPFASMTLIQGLQLRGGPGVSGADEILLRAAVAALLNASHPGLSYPLSPAMVILSVNTALASNNRATILTLATLLDGYNNSGCPLS